MNHDWDRQWIVICLGIVTIASAAVGAAFFSAKLADLTISAASLADFTWLYGRLLASVFVAAIYLTLVRHAETAIFATDFELAKTGINRRQAARHIYQGLFFIVSGLLILLVFNVFEELAASLNTAAMAPTDGD